MEYDRGSDALYLRDVRCCSASLYAVADKHLSTRYVVTRSISFMSVDPESFIEYDTCVSYGCIFLSSPLQ